MLNSRKGSPASHPIQSQWKESKKGKVLVNTVTGDILARYVKAKDKADDRIEMF